MSGKFLKVEYNDVKYNAEEIEISGKYIKTIFSDADKKIISSEMISTYSLEEGKPKEERTTSTGYVDGKARTEVTQSFTRLPNGNIEKGMETKKEGIGTDNEKTVITEYEKGNIPETGIWNRGSSGNIKSQIVTETKKTKLEGGGFVKYETRTETYKDGREIVNPVVSVNSITIENEVGEVLRTVNVKEGSDKDKINDFLIIVSPLSAEAIDVMLDDLRVGNELSVQSGGTGEIVVNGKTVTFNENQRDTDPSTGESITNGVEVNGKVYTPYYIKEGNTRTIIKAREVNINNRQYSFVEDPGWFSVEGTAGTQMYAGNRGAPVMYTSTSAGVTYTTVTLRTPDGITYITFKGVSFDKETGVITGTQVDTSGNSDEAKAAKANEDKQKDAFKNVLLGYNIEETLNVVAGFQALGIKMQQWFLGKWIDSAFGNLFQEPGDVLCRATSGIGGYSKPNREEISEDGVAGYTDARERYAWLSAIKAPGVRVLCSSTGDCKAGFVCNIDGVCQKGTECAEGTEGYSLIYGICPAAPLEFQTEQFYKISFWLKATNNDVVFNIFLFKERETISSSGGLRLMTGEGVSGEQPFVKILAGETISSSDEQFFQGSVKYLPEDYTKICYIFDNGDTLCNLIATKTADNAELYADAAGGAAPGGAAGGISLTWGE